MFALRNLNDTQKSWSADKLDAMFLPVFSFHILWTDTHTHGHMTKYTAYILTLKYLEKMASKQEVYDFSL